MKIAKLLLIITIVGSLCSCGNNSKSNSSYSTSLKSSYSSSYDFDDDYDDEDDDERIYSDQYKYNYKQGGYYNYDVSGYDEYGNYVWGNVDISSDGGDGYIEDEDGNEIEIDVYWTGYGEIEGEDWYGNTYELEVD